MAKRVLFLCTGNYYRSRFAEALFNALATEAGLAWRAESRGLALCADNVGPISPYTLRRLAAIGVAAPEPLAAPRALQADELTGADLVIALSESEHRPMMRSAFPAWADRARYWQVEDLHLTTVDEALAALETAVRDLVAALATAEAQGKDAAG